MRRNNDSLPALPAAITALCVALVAPACDDDDLPAPSASAAVDDQDASERLAPASDDLDGAHEPVLAPAGFFIEKITTSGKGCPDPESVSVVVSGEKKLMRLFFDEMALNKPPGGSLQYLSCTVAVELHVPAGWSVSPVIVSSGGYADLDAGIKARQTSKYFFAGAPLAAGHEKNLAGEYDDYFFVTKAIPIASQVWSPCGGSAIMGITAGLLLNAKDNPGGQGAIKLNSEKVLYWKWKKC